MNTCPICKLPYGRTYEEHTGKQQHKDAVAKAVGRTLLPEDPSDIAVVSDARRRMWLTDWEKRQLGIPDFSAFSTDRALNCCGSREGHESWCETVQP